MCWQCWKSGVDGVRALWDGASLRFRSGRPIAAPAWFLAGLPAVALDGELWLGRQRFETLSGSVRKQVPVDGDWRALRYMVFDLPHHPAPFAQRAERITELVAAALANGVVPAHNVCLDLKNTDVVFADASRARNEFGFLRMWSIYPLQIEAIVKAMQPDFSEVEDGAAILLLAQAADWGPIQYKGELHDRATYRYFWSCLQRAAVTGVPIPADAKAAFFG